MSNARILVVDDEADIRELGAVARREMRRDADLAVRVALERLDRVGEQVVQHLAQPALVGQDGGERRIQRDLEAHAPAHHLRAIEVGHLGHQPVQPEARHLEARRARVLAERVHHLLHRLDLLHDGLGAAVEELRVLLVHRRQQLVAHALGREADRRERVLDLVRQSARHLAPGGLALGLQHHRDVVEHEHEAGGRLALALAGQRRAGAHQDAPRHAGLERELLAPLEVARRDARAARLGELPQQAVGLAEAGEIAAHAGLEVIAEDGGRRSVGGAHAQVGLERDHARGQSRQDDREIGALGFGGLLRELLVLPRPAQPLGHVVERVHQEAHLVVRGERQARVEVALRDRARALHQVLDRLHEFLRGEDRAVPRRQQRQQQYDREREDEARLEGSAQVVLLAELLVGGLQGVGQRGDALGNRVDGLHHQPTATRCALSERHGRAHDVAARGLGLEAHERPALADLQQHLVRDVLRHDVRRQSLADGHDRAVVGRYRDLERARLPPQLLEQRPRGTAGGGEPVGDDFGGREVLAHARLERRARQHERVVEALADLDVEPAVDAAVEELHGEEIHEQDRQRREHAEDPHHAGLEPRADDVAPPVAHELRELGEQQADQHHESRDVDHQDPRVQPAELFGMLGGLHHEQDRGQPQQAAEADHDHRGRATQRRSDHANHSLVAFQSSVQKSTQPSVSGTVCRLSSARTRNS